MKYFIDTEFIEGFSKWTFAKNRHFIDLISIGIIAEDGRTYYAVSNEYRYDDADQWVKDNVITPAYINSVHGDQRNRYTVANFHKHYGKSNEKIAQEIIDFINFGLEGFVYKITRADCWAEVYYPDEFKYCKEHNTFIPNTFYKSGDNGIEKNMFLFYNQPEFYGYYADYDWVLFCSLFGRMIDLPKGFPMYCKDLKQMLDEKVDKSTLAYYGTDLEGSGAGENFEGKMRLIKAHIDYPKQSNEHNALDDAKWNFELYKFIKSL